jgi:arginine deiminase
MENKMKLNVKSEIGRLTKVLIHSPDGGIGNIPPSKLHDWLYDDIIDVEKTQREHKIFVELLLLFLDSEKLYNEDGKYKKTFEANPEKDDYFGIDYKNSNVLDTQFVLQKLFEEFKGEAKDLIESICSIEDVHPFRKEDVKALIDNGKYADAVKTLLTGKLEYQLKVKVNDKELVELKGEDVSYIFPPIPNFIFTRDIGVTLGEYLLITKPKFYIRKREVILLRFIAENYLFKPKSEEEKDKQGRVKIIEISNDDEFFQLEESLQKEKCVNYEGGDFMMISENHLLIGCSERTSPYAIEKLVYRLFWKGTGINTISVIKISEKRSQMHIDTVLSHVGKDCWVMYAPLSEVWKEEQEKKPWREKPYIDELLQKSENQIEKEEDVSIFQFYLNCEGLKHKTKYNGSSDNEVEVRKVAKDKFKKVNFLLRADKEGNYSNPCGSNYKRQPKGLEDLLKQISVHEYGAEEDKVKIIYSGGGETPYMEREQYTDACNLLILKEGVAVGYDRNLHTAKDFHETMVGKCKEDGSRKHPSELSTKYKYDGNEIKKEDDELAVFLKAKNEVSKLNEFLEKKNVGCDFKTENVYVFHAEDLLSFVKEKNVPQCEIGKLTEAIQNALILIPSDELSRARGGSHCMSMPLFREKVKLWK